MPFDASLTDTQLHELIRLETRTPANDPVFVSQIGAWWLTNAYADKELQYYGTLAAVCRYHRGQISNLITTVTGQDQVRLSDWFTHLTEMMETAETKLQIAKDEAKAAGGKRLGSTQARGYASVGRSCKPWSKSWNPKF